MYILNKIVGWISSPLALAIIAAVLGIVLVLKGKRRMGALAFGGVVAWICIWSMPVMGLVVGVPLEREFLVDGRVPLVETFPNADAIVVLGGGVGCNPALSPYAEMAAFADRVWQAARLWKAGKAPKVVATGFSPRESNLGLLNDFGVPEDKIVFLDARNTEEEAKAVRKIVKSKILLVTSAWHMKRARLMFEKYAPELEVICAPADFEYSMITKRPLYLRDFLPDSAAFFHSSVAIHEWIGLMGYKLFR